MKEKMFKKGDRVKWVGIGNGSRVPHEGLVVGVVSARPLYRNFVLPGYVKVAEVEVRTFHKRTGKPNKPFFYRILTSLLTLVKR